jgi:hypothetical protein
MFNEIPKLLKRMKKPSDSWGLFGFIENIADLISFSVNEAVRTTFSESRNFSWASQISSDEDAQHDPFIPNIFLQ